VVDQEGTHNQDAVIPGGVHKASTIKRGKGEEGGRGKFSRGYYEAPEIVTLQVVDQVVPKFHSTKETRMKHRFMHSP